MPQAPHISPSQEIEKLMKLNARQNIPVLVGTIIITLMLLWPPFSYISGDTREFIGFTFIFGHPKYPGLKIDFYRLAYQIFIVLVPISCWIFMLRGTNSKVSQTNQN